jgi:GntR family transcriptional regulator
MSNPPSELPDATIDRASPVPFYFQLAQLLEEEIVTGRWAPGTRIASEAELGSCYGLSRTTIRQALARLEQEGLVSREKGRGSFVRSSQLRSWMIQSTEGFFQGDFLRTGHAVTSRVLNLARVGLPLWACDALALDNGADGVVVERLRSVEGLVALYVINYLPASVADAVLGLDPDESLYQRLADRGGIAVVGGNRSIGAVNAGAKLAELLEVDAGAALAYIESVSRDRSGQPVDCYRAWLRTDRMRIDVQVATSRTSELPSPDLVTWVPT